MKSAAPRGRDDHFVVRNGVRCAGVHLIVDLYEAERLDDLDHIETTLRRCVEAAGATLLHVHLHHFEPNGGISGVAVLAESHISIHSWPEARYAAFDIFMCGKADPDRCVPVLREAFRPRRVAVSEILRGETSEDGERARTTATQPSVVCSPSSDVWIPETLFDPLGLRMTYAAERVLHETRTGHQHLVLFEHRLFGKMLMLDGATQVTSRDEFIYHEMMTHVPILAHGRAREVLIVGGGDCGIAKEVLKHLGVTRLTQVEIDAAVIDFAKQHFPELADPVLADARFDLVIDDGMKFVAATDRRFDVIIVDSTDPQGPGAVLFTSEFYAGCKRCLTPDGVLVTQNGVPFLQPEELVGSVRHFAKLFADAACYVAAIPTYVGGHMAMGWATDDRALGRHSAETIAQRYDAAGRFATKYWTPEVHCAAFAVPRFIADHVAAARRG